MSDVARPGWVAIEPEPPELQERNDWIGVRLMAASTAFLFLPFVFAYLYLASLNTSGMWRPGHLKAPLGWGLVILAAVVLSAALVALARADYGNEALARAALVGGLVLGIAAVVLQLIEYTRLSFGPTDGGFASVFVGWTGLYVVIVLVTMLWLEIAVASLLRSGQPVSSRRSEVDAVGFYWAFVAGLGVLTFVFLYLL
jgi:heme/copper-type cytochrome/quinol oxidase subunit 3